MSCLSRWARPTPPSHHTGWSLARILHDCYREADSRLPVLSVTCGLRRQTRSTQRRWTSGRRSYQPDRVIADAGLQPHGGVDGAGPPRPPE